MSSQEENFQSLRGWNHRLTDFLDLLAYDAKETFSKGYYSAEKRRSYSNLSFRKMILESKDVPVITEVKAASPALGVITEKLEAGKLAKAMEKGGAVGISVITEPEHFKGSLSSLVEVRRAVKLPVLMKDIIINPEQLKTASRIGADAVLLIQSLFERGYCECEVQEMIWKAHEVNLEVLLETHNEKEFQSAIAGDADLVGINNRDLRTLKVDLGVTKRVLSRNESEGKIIVSESGLRTADDIRFLSKFGAQAFLIGTAVVSAPNVEEKVKEFVSAL